MQNEVINPKNDVKILQESTNSILLAMQGLSTKYETCIGGINDRLISLSKQINNKDRFMTDFLENYPVQQITSKLCSNKNQTKF